jgi:hypothetical protein
MRPGSQSAPGHLRASDADRERVLDALKAAFTQGWLTREELDARAGQALTSRTYAELTGAVAGLRPAPSAAARPRPVLPALPPRKPVVVRARKPVNRALRRKMAGWGAAVVLLSGAAAAFLTSLGGFFVIFALVFAAMVVTSGPSAAPCRPVPGAARARFYRG